MNDKNWRIVVVACAPSAPDALSKLLEPGFSTSFATANEVGAGADHLDAVLLVVSDAERMKFSATVNAILERRVPAPLLVITSTPDAHLESEAMRLGAQDCLPLSGLTADNLRRAIRCACERYARVAELDRTSRNLRHFAHVVAHELRSPLTILLASTDILLRSHAPRLDGAVREWIDQARGGAREMSDLVTQILVFAEAGIAGDIDPVDCNSLVARVRASLATRAPGVAANLTNDALPTVLANEIVLRYVFQGLIAAVIDPHATPPHIHITCRTTRQGKLFRIEHNGRSVTPGEFDRLLDLFSHARAGGARRPPINLVFAKDAIERMGGRIWTETGADRHAFNIQLPDVTA